MPESNIPLNWEGAKAEADANRVARRTGLNMVDGVLWLYLLGIGKRVKNSNRNRYRHHSISHKTYLTNRPALLHLG